METTTNKGYSKNGKRAKSEDFTGALMSTYLKRRVDDLMTIRMTYVKNLGSQPSDDELNYLATITDLASQLRTAVILAERAIYFKTKI